MFRKLHLKLTLFCIFVTGSIFLALTGICLAFAVKNINQTNYTSFLNGINAAITHLQEQDYISHQWLNQLQGNQHFKIFLYDNQTPLYYQQYHTSEEDQTLSEEVIQNAREQHNMDIFAASNRTLTYHTEFAFQSSGQENYYVSAGTIPKNNGHLSFLVLYSQAEQQAQIFRLKMTILAADCCGILLLAFFFNYFTKRMLEPIAESQKKQTLFIASASHELRTPLAVLRSGMEAISKAEHPSEQKNFVHIMTTECTRMERLIGDMLILANADSESLVMHMAPCQPDTLLLNVYEKFEPLAIQKKLRLSITLPEDLMPDCVCDAGRIEQALSILMDNALSYTPAEGRINLSLKYADHFIFFSVADSGCGIPDSEKKLIFERFYRADQSRTDKEHFGLGLCIAKEIVKKHQGEIWAEDNILSNHDLSAEDKSFIRDKRLPPNTVQGGSRFVIKLPAL